MPPIYNTVRHLFIINPKSFRHKWKQVKAVTKIHDFFKLAENNNYEIHISRFPRDAACFIPLYAEKLGKETTLRVYAVGGDGILFDCLNGVMGLENAELAAIPYGHTNNFVRAFRKNDKSLFQSIPRQYHSPAIPLNVMRCGNNYALNCCAVGLEADAALRAGKMRERMDRGSIFMQWLGRRLYTSLYIIGGLISCWNKKLLNRQYEVEIDGNIISGNYWGLSVFNGPVYGGNMRPVNNAVPDDGILDILLTRVRKIITYFLFPFYITGRYKIFPGIFTLKQGRKVSIRCEEPLVISMDNEVFFENELSVELLPSAVKFVNAGRHDYTGGWK